MTGSSNHHHAGHWKYIPRSPNEVVGIDTKRGVFRVHHWDDHGPAGVTEESPVTHEINAELARHQAPDAGIDL